MEQVPSVRPSPESKRRSALRWGLPALLLLILAVVVALMLNPGGPPVTAGPGDPPDSGTEEPSSPASDDPPASDPPSGNPSEDPTDEPADNPTDAPTASGSPTASSSPSPAGPLTPAGPGELDEDSAAAVVSSAIGAPLTSADTEAALADVLAGVAVEGYAAELEAQWLELTSQGWSMTGSPHIESLEITTLDTDSDPASAEIVACIDSSEVTMIDAAGDPVGDPSATSPRALHQYTMVQGNDGIWRISSHSFPNDPSC